MGQGILVNMRVCTGLYLPETGSGLHIAGVGDTEWQALEVKKDASGGITGIKIGDAESLESCIGSGYDRFGKDE